MCILAAGFVLTLCLIPLASGAPSPRAVGPTVTLDGTTFVGKGSVGSVSSFLGIPFAQPPVGDLRFRLPVPIQYASGTTQLAKSFGHACPQQAVRVPVPDLLPSNVLNFITDTAFKVVAGGQEDCLTINVIKPSTIPAGQKLPVLVWIFGGGFEIGGTSTYDGTGIVRKSIAMGKPVIYVSMNYRVSLFGFLASKEVKDAGVGNLGLQDQREALRWIQKYIGQFGGDPSKVTIWGESAGAISVGLHMVANNGDNEGLFRAGFMQSGSPIPVGDITNGQRYYDTVVAGSGCAGASDTLACLRTVDYRTLLRLMNNSPGLFSYQSLNLAWLPRTDGTFLRDSPQQSVLQGHVARIPIVTGDCDDEGTLFSLSNLNITTEFKLRGYLRDNYVTGITDNELNTLLSLYPNNPREGSPFSTGLLNVLGLQYKRLASIQGDLVFQAPRRFFIEQIEGKQDVWVFLSTRHKPLPFIGAAHATDLLNVYGIGEMRDYLINFTNDLNPNGGLLFPWPKWSSATNALLTFSDGLIRVGLGLDTYRKEAMNFVSELSLKYPI